MTARPEVKPAIVATATNFPVSSDSWSNQPTKGNPGDPTIAAGWTPRLKPPAIWVNYLDNLSGRWVTYIADIQVMNWRDPVEPITSIGLNDAVWDAGAERWYVVAGGSEAAESPRGRSWTTIVPGFAIDMAWVAAKPLAGTAHTGSFSIAGSDSSNIIAQRRNGAWVSTNTTVGTDRTAFGLYNPSANRFVVAGTDGANIMAFYSQEYTSDAVLPLGWTRVVQNNTYSSDPIGIAWDTDDNIICIVGDGNGTNSDSWVSIDGGLNWDHYTNSIQNPTALAWDDALKLFICITTTGTVWYSIDGQTWVVFITLTLPGTVTADSLVCVGSLRAFTVGEQIVYSNDLTIWRRIYGADIVGKLRYALEREELFCLANGFVSSSLCVGLPRTV